MFEKIWSFFVWLSDHALVVLVGMLCITFAFVLFFLITSKKQDEKKQQQIKHGKKDKTLKLAPIGTGKGIVFGKLGSRELYLPAGCEGHCLCLGGSGCGKTSSFLIPSLESFTRRGGGTFFAIDISSDITNALKPILQDDIIIFDPWNESSNVTWDVFNSLDNCNGDQQLERIEQLAFVLMPQDVAASAAARYFQDGGRSILSAAILAFSRDLDFCDICKKIVSTTWRDLFNEIDAVENPVASSMLNGFKGVSESNVAGCYQNTVDAVKMFSRGVISKKFARGGITPADLNHKSISLCIPDHQLKISKDMLALISSQVLEFFSARPSDEKHPILFALDEFASLGSIDIVDGLRKYRKRHINIIVVTQSLADLEVLYGKEKVAVLYNNFKYKSVLQISDHETQNRVSLEVGDVTSVSISTTKQSCGTSSITRSESTRRVLEPSCLATLPAHDICLLVHPNGVLTLKKNYYFKNKKFGR